MSRVHNGSSNGYRKGPVLLRRGQVPESTSDQRLLSPHQGSDWVHADPWRVMRIQSEFVEGFGALAELGPAISVFGSARSGAMKSGGTCSMKSTSPFLNAAMALLASH